jgi:hypothetical protein
MLVAKAICWFCHGGTQLLFEIVNNYEKDDIDIFQTFNDNITRERFFTNTES